MSLDKIRFRVMDEESVILPGSGPGFGERYTDRQHKDDGNRKFAKENEEFKNACAASGTEPTPRQAGKWRRKTGKAWQHVHAAG